MNQEVFIPIKISTRKGRRAVVQKLGDRCVSTPFSRLLVKAYMLESQLQRNTGITLKEFCEINNISPRYVRSILAANKTKPENSGYDYGRIRPATPFDSGHYQQKIPDPMERSGGGVCEVMHLSATSLFQKRKVRKSLL